MRSAIILAAGAVLLVPSLARPQGVQIDHKAVGCIVVGKYPKMNACLTPVADVARARVYFRPEGIPSWYYVDMKADQACHAGVLPKPGKKLVGKKIEYYVETQDKAFSAARTAEYAPTVVSSAQECKKQVPVAPFLNNASVAVFPSVPAGFTAVGGTIGTGALIGVAGAGAAAASTAVVVASNNNNDTTTTTVGAALNTTTTVPAVATTSTTTTTTLAPRANRSPFAVLTVSPDPPSGSSPLTITFDLCKSTDPDPGDSLSFFFDFGDGAKTQGSCSATHTYTASFRGLAGSPRALDSSYAAEGCVVDSSGQSQCRSRGVVVQVPIPTTTTTTTTTTTMCPTPSVVITGPPGTFVFCDFAVTADTTNTDNVTFCVTSAGCFVNDCHAGTQAGSTFSHNFSESCTSNDYRIDATATNLCGNTANASPKTGIFNSCSSGFRKGEGLVAAWSSDLKMDGARLQVIVNGSMASYPDRGRSFATARIRDGENRMEATVVEAGGKSGTWTIDFSASPSIQPSSIRVLGGQVESIASTSVTFRLRGTSGERVAFTFVNRK